LLPPLARQRFAFAPDMLGNGDSAPPASETVEMQYYVDCAVRIMDTLGIDKVDFYGAHTGAQIGCQLAVTYPQRVRRLVLDGIPLFAEDFRQRLLANYAPKVTPDDHGGHLSWAWNFVRRFSGPTLIASPPTGWRMPWPRRRSCISASPTC
jgi:pimeloyl-ACP methyl ester carboxylesterase